MTEAPGTTLSSLRAGFALQPHPVIVFNKSHSGSRILTELLQSAGVFMGAHCNESGDSLDMFELVDFLVRRYYPDYGPLWDPHREPDDQLQDIARRMFQRHLEGFQPGDGRLWGWKLCETTYILPVLDFIFPNARDIHLIRDGRDVAFCDHHGPSDPFWRKIYFNTDRIRTFHGMRLTGPSYRRRSAVFNALHWANSVTVGNNFGQMLRERYLDVRYERLCADFPAAARRILEFAGVPDPGSAISRMQPKIRSASVGKYRRHSRRELQPVMDIVKPLLLELGYLPEDDERPRPSIWHSALADRWLDRLRARRKSE